MSEQYDTVIKNARIVDGTGAPVFRGEVAVKGDRVAAVSRERLSTDTQIEVDAQGCVVSPGFIDVHNHGDASIMMYPNADGFIRQGITTFVGGQCGASPAPVGEMVYLPGFYNDQARELGPEMYYRQQVHSRERVNAVHVRDFGFPIDWHTAAEYFQRMEKIGFTPNYVLHAGHGTLRTVAMGDDYTRKATPAEVEVMKEALRGALRDGCIGFSVGGDYEPGIYADPAEILELAKVLPEYGGMYAIHMLRSGLRGAKPPGTPGHSALKSLTDEITLARKAGIPIQVSHLGSVFTTTPGNRALAETAIQQTFKIIDDARASGLDIEFDVIPNHQSGGVYGNIWLIAALEPWDRITGGPEKLAEALKMWDFREEIKERIQQGIWYGLNPHQTPGWAEAKLIAEHRDPKYQGKTIARIAAENKTSTLDALMDAIQSDPHAKVGRSPSDDWAKLAFYRYPTCMLGVDTYITDHTFKWKHPPYNLPNENNFGGFPLFFQRAVRETGTLTIEEAVQRTSSIPAKRYRLRDRGVLKPGAYADIVVMDIEKVAPTSTPTNPCSYPVGINHVWVNGIQVVKESQHTGARPGRILRRGAS